MDVSGIIDENVLGIYYKLLLKMKRCDKNVDYPTIKTDKQHYVAFIELFLTINITLNIFNTINRIGY